MTITYRGRTHEARTEYELWWFVLWLENLLKAEAAFAALPCASRYVA